MRIRIREVVYFLSYVIAIIGVLSVVRFINPVFSFIFLLALILGYKFDRQNKYPIPRIILNIVAVLVLFLLFPKSIDNLVVPLSEILIVLLSIKLIEPKEFRDFMQIYTLSIFLLSASALLSIDILFILYFFLLFFLVVISAVLLTFMSEDENLSLDKISLKKFIIKISFIPIFAIPSTIILFAVLPRTENPLFSFLNNQGKAKSGFSDVVNLGDVSEIQQNSTPIMRVKMDRFDNVPLYWRGTTLTFFTGKFWLRKYIFNENVRFPKSALKINQTIILEPYGDKFLFALDKPLHINAKNIWVFSDLTFEKRNVFFNRIKYNAVSKLSTFMYADNVNESIYLQIPKRLPKRVYSLAEKLKGRTPEETIKNVSSYMRKNYKYSLKKLPTGNNSLENFLFKYKYGSCEYFASATAILLRLNGIPTRIVVGYRGGKYNDIGKYYLITQSDAHSWVEYYLNGKWVRLDTTPPLSNTIAYEELKKSSKLDVLMDTLQYYWINFIINYDLQKQKELINQIRGIVKKPSFSMPDININRDFLIKFLLFLVILIGGYFWLREYIFIKEEEKYLKKFLKKLAKYNIKREKTEGLEELLAKIDDRDLYLKAKRFVEIYERAVYKNHHFKREDREEIQKILKEL